MFSRSPGLEVRAGYNSVWLPQHNAADQAAIKMLIDSFIRTTNRGGGRVEKTQTATDFQDF